MNLRDAIYRFQLTARQKLIAAKYSAKQTKIKGVLDSQFRPSNILIVLSGLLGDSVMSSVAIGAARDEWPGAKITVLGKSHNCELLAADPNIDEFRVFNADPFSLRRSAETRELEGWLATQGFDLAVILLGDQFAHLLAKAGIPVRVGVKGTVLEPCLTHSYEIGSPREWGANEKLNSLRVLGREVQSRVPMLYVDKEARISAKAKLSGLGLRNEERYLVLHPFGSTPRQWWPLENIPKFVDEARGKAGTRTVLIGGNETRSADVGTSGLIDTRGTFSVRELLAVIDGAEMVITTDSGPFHIAGGLGKKTIGLFRDRRPEHASAYPTDSVILGKHEACRNECEWDRCAADPCRQMRAVSLADVLDIV